MKDLTNYKQSVITNCDEENTFLNTTLHQMIYLIKTQLVVENRYIIS